MSNSAIQGQYIQFGSAFLFVNPNAQNLAAVPMPVFPLTVQDVEVSIKGKAEKLRGQYQWPDDVALGDKDGTGKFGIGRKDWYLFNQIFGGDTVAAGGKSVSPLEAHTVPGSIAYTVTVTPPGSGTFDEDLGVLYAATGLRFQKVLSLTQAGQYTVSAGVYTFYSGDANASVIISYTYTLASAGNTYQTNNQYMGYSPQCEFFLVDRYQLVAGVSNTLHLPSVKVTSLGNVGNKRDKHSMPEIEFEFFANASGRVMNAYVAAG